ncbi:aspartyl-phosphate phosphatase Spo0E family protein [Ureibacillus composti]|uniref:Aspartyl-phosphate phosphatase Spo0E family protein n=1 Tax=Lysinibacillus composti TaxID=720633 RepID=A0A3N9UU96_9BACI|nr:aspartyl-phosphate phosphatase Spo0E family protein [Lysinibacillus composti]MBM7607402.1 hypothetical protein [Lysinibacillus composti]MDM5334257.1 aspartyl-phosphate phosphatase Spo0E family protein [Ureibacillus composti]RQW76042.1 aspartyl-phosphate phosphatase Spo0E family protein [Lysinibacillus composti]
MAKEHLPLIELENKVFNLQAQMIDLGLVKGLSHPETVKCSQELDRVLNRLQNIKMR